MDLIDQLHRYLVYAKSADIKVPLDQVTDFGKEYPKMWKTYCEFQEKYAERIALLRLEKREVPKEANADTPFIHPAPPRGGTKQSAHTTRAPALPLSRGGKGLAYGLRWYTADHDRA